MEIFLNNFKEEGDAFSEINVINILKDVIQVSSLANTIAGNFQIGISIVSSEEIQKLNLEYRGKDQPTNVLSFGTNSHLKDNDSLLLGDIVLCKEIIEKEAKEYLKTYENRLKHMIIHGFLHLIGFNHEENHERISMEEIEIQVMNNLSAGDPY
ncbi:MAG: rRNA maturation RNase YbeY [Flavobacteriaceae bacterium]|jgi:probable rRNA maturation factor|nr:rRNA maturation RNase YbeY [Flavobacteriaceae bacterium]|tara:strand:- start:8155 stop:8616 length:462 start_codon:yes stop_codon:yes gene_type:complete